MGQRGEPQRGGGQEEDKDKKLTGRAEVGKIIDDVLTKAK